MAEVFDVVSYNFAEAPGVPITITEEHPIFETVVTMTTPDLPPGTYEMGANFVMNYSTKDASAFFKITGTYSVGTEFSDAAPTDSDDTNRYYLKPIIHTGGTVTISLEVGKHTSLSTLLVNYASVIVRRVA